MNGGYHSNLLWHQQDLGVYAQEPRWAGQYAYHDCSEPNMSDIMLTLAFSSEVIKNLVLSEQVFQQNVFAFQQGTRATLRSMSILITELTSQLNEMEANQGEFPSQMELNHTECVSAVTIRSESSSDRPEPKQEDEKSNLAENKKDEDEKDILEYSIENFGDDELEQVIVSALSEEDGKSEENDAIKEIIRLMYSAEELSVRNLPSSMPISTREEQLPPSVEEPPNLELKVLSEPLNFVCLEEQDTMHVIISKDVFEEQNFQLRPPPHSSRRSPPPTESYPHLRTLHPPIRLHYPLVAKILWIVCMPFKKGRYHWPPPKIPKDQCRG